MYRHEFTGMVLEFHFLFPSSVLSVTYLFIYLIYIIIFILFPDRIEFKGNNNKISPGNPKHSARLISISNPTQQNAC